jgi:putative endonuclease
MEKVGSVMEAGMRRAWQRFKVWLGRLSGGRLCAPTPANTSAAGTRWERHALAYLQEQGLTLLAANFRCPGGEIDLVMREGATLVFVEVRQRSSASHGGAAASVTIHKQRRLLRAAGAWLARYRDGAAPPCRIDVVAVDGETITWLRDAVQTPA